MSTVIINTVNSEEFVREPVDKEVNGIISSSTKKIILTGGKGIGKSTVLYSLEKRGLGSKEQTIYYYPEQRAILGKEPSKICDTRVFDYLAELKIASGILSFIKDNYPILFKKEFKKEMEIAETLLKQLENQINASPFIGTTIKCPCGIMKLTSDILSRFRTKMEIDKLNIAIDRFDQMNDSSEYMQKAHKKYFEMFDRVILAVADPNLDAHRLSSQGYDLRSISYGKDKNVLEEIIRRKTLNSDYQKYIGFFTSGLFLDKMSELDGNLNLVLATYKALGSEFDFRGINNIDKEKVLDETIESQKVLAMRITRNSSKPKLYL